MDPIYDSWRVRSICSDVVIFPTTNMNRNYKSINEYIDDQYKNRSLYLRDMIIAQNTKPTPIISNVSENTTNLFIITFTVTPVYVERKSEDPYSVIDLDTGGISVSGTGGEINSIEKSSPSQWIVHVNKSGLTLHIAENTFRNKYGNGNDEKEYPE